MPSAGHTEGSDDGMGLILFLTARISRQEISKSKADFDRSIYLGERRRPRDSELLQETGLVDGSNLIEANDGINGQADFGCLDEHVGRMHRQMKPRRDRASKSVDTPLAGFGRWPHRRGAMAMPAAFRYALAVSRRTPMALSMRRSGHPSCPNAITCCRFSSLKTFAIPAATHASSACVNVLAHHFPLAGFQVSIIGRFWVSTEASGHSLGSDETVEDRGR